MDGRLPRLMKALAVAIALFLVSCTSFASAEEEDEDLQGYESILSDLNREAAQPPASMRARGSAHKPAVDPFENIWIHMGVGLANPIQSINFDDGKTAFVGQKGVQASLGIDLFSENWMAEGTARSFGETDDASTRVSLKEFELKIFYKDRISKQFGFRAGGGISGRYMTIHRVGLPTIDYTTPSSVATGGLDVFLTEKLSLGVDLSARNAMISETLDRVSYDATFRMDTHF